MMSNIKNAADHRKTWFTNSAAGACSGIFTRTVCQPFDVLKIRFQLQVEPLSKNSKNSTYKSISQSISLILREEGVNALWKGLIPGQLLSFTYGLTQFGMYQMSLAYLSKNENELNQTSSIHFICGVCGTSTATLTSYPFDVVRTRLVAQKSNQIYSNMREVFTSIYKTQGLFAYYRGFFPNLIQNSLQGGFMFMFYNRISKLFSTNTSNNKTSNDDYLNGLKQFSSGFLSGIASKTLVYPLDVVKKRLQLQDFIHSRDGFGEKFICNGLWNCVRLTIKEESFLGLFKGLSPSLLKAGFVTALHLTVYEQMYTFFDALVNSNN